MTNFTRRSLLASAFTPALFARKAIDLSRISVLTDECADSAAEANAFAKQYGLRWVELRGVPTPGRRGSVEYIRLPENELLAAAKELKQHGLAVSFLNTGMLKYQLPGTEPARPRQETPEQRTKRLEREKQTFDRRFDTLRSALRAAEIFNVRKVRVFTFTRTADPAALFPEIVKHLEELAREAKSKGVDLLIENEGSCNVATAAELRDLFQLVKAPNLGINWDPINALSREKEQFPAAYNLLPKKKLGNVQMKAQGLVLGNPLLPWGDIFQALTRDGYKGQIGLETHVFDGTNLEKAHLSMAALKKIVAPSS